MFLRVRFFRHTCFYVFGENRTRKNTCAGPPWCQKIKFSDGQWHEQFSQTAIISLHLCYLPSGMVQDFASDALCSVSVANDSLNQLSRIADASARLPMGKHKISVVFFVHCQLSLRRLRRVAR